MKLGEVIKHRKGSIIIDDNVDYKLCRVQLHRRGVVLREVLQGRQIKTKKQQVCKAGDFLVAEMDAKVGGYGFVPKDLDGAIVSSHYFLFELDEEKIRPGFLEVVSKLGLLQEQIKATGSTNYAAIRPANVLDWKIPSLDIEHQIEIENLFAQATEKSNELSSELTHQLSLVKQLRQAFLREAMQGKLVHQDPNDEPASELVKKIKARRKQWIIENEKKGNREAISLKRKLLKIETTYPKIPEIELPSKWRWLTVIEIANLIVDCHNKTAPYKSSGIPLIRTTNVRNGELNLDQTKFVSQDTYEYWSRRCPPLPGDIVYTREAPVGEAAIIPPNTFLCLGQRMMLVRLFNELVNPKYILFCLIDPSFLMRLSHLQKGAMVKHLRVGDVENAFLPLPPLQEQHRIVAKLEQLMNYCDGLEQSIKKSQTQNEQLLQQVLREALQPKEEYEKRDGTSLAVESNLLL